jgi:hypothetical protein
MIKVEENNEVISYKPDEIHIKLDNDDFIMVEFRAGSKYIQRDSTGGGGFYEIQWIEVEYVQIVNDAIQEYTGDFDKKNIESFIRIYLNDNDHAEDYIKEREENHKEH